MHSTTHGRSSAQTNVSLAQAFDPLQSNKHSPSLLHSGHAASQPSPGLGGASPHASTTPVVPLELSEVPLVLPGASVVPVVVAGAEDVELSELACAPVLDVDSSPELLSELPEPRPNTLGEQPKRNAKEIASPRTPKA